MTGLFLYSIKSAIVLTMLYLPYMLMLQKESFFRFNRLMLLGILLMSLVLPLCNVPGLSLDNQPVVQAAQLQMLEFGIPIHVLPEVQVVAYSSTQGNGVGLSVFTIITLIYIAGMSILLIMRLWQVGQLQRGIHSGALWKQEEDGVTICCHAEDVAPFSWMRCIIISKTDYDEAGQEIILHEKGHIFNHHSWDVLLLTLVQMLQWWNPLVYALGISLRDVHEYEADDHVLRSGVSAQSYQLLLIKKAVGSGSYAFANSFNHSLTKKRITMMKKSKSNPWMRSKALYAVPVALLALSAFATPKFVKPIEGAVAKLESKSTENSAELQVIEGKNEKFTVTPTQSVPHNPAMRYLVNGHDVTMDEALALNSESIKSVHLLQGEATENLMGKETVYIVSDDPKYANANMGKLNYNTKTGRYEAIEDENEKQITFINNERATEEEVKEIDPKQIAHINVLGPETASKIYGKEAKGGAIQIETFPETETPEDKGDSIFNRPAVNAKYPGGDAEFFTFMMHNIRYPNLCKWFGFQGRVIMKFVVEKDGSISNIEKVRGPGMKLTQKDVDDFKQDNPESQEQPRVGQDLGDLLTEEGIRVLKLMPNWEPARDEKGNPVRSFFNVPMMFKLN